MLKNEQGTAPPEKPEKPGQEQGQGEKPQPGDNQFEEFVKNPTSLYGKTADEVANMLGEGWTKGNYGVTGTGWKFTKGDKIVFYHEGGRHDGPYYGFSSGVTGKVKIVGPGYKPLPGDKARIIPASGE